MERNIDTSERQREMLALLSPAKKQFFGRKLLTPQQPPFFYEAVALSSHFSKLTENEIGSAMKISNSLAKETL